MEGGGSGLTGWKGGRGKEAGEFAASSVCSVGLTLESAQFPPQQLRFAAYVTYSIFYMFYNSPKEEEKKPKHIPLSTYLISPTSL